MRPFYLSSVFVGFLIYFGNVSDHGRSDAKKSRFISSACLGSSVEGNESRKTVSTVKRLLKKIEETVDDEQFFGASVTALAEYLGYNTRSDHISKLFKTISDASFHVAFEADKYKHISITFHSSKGLEFEQVIVFAEDYRLSDMSSIYNHYVAVTRAKSKLIIVKLNNYNANCFQNNLQKIFSESGHNIEDVVLF